MQAMNPNSRREAILVLGMHRSGTSALAGMLAKLGAQPPRTLMPARVNNPEGYWESAALMRFHDELLASAGSEWRDWEPFNPGWADSAVAGRFAETLPPLLEQEFGDARLMLVKDPRICRFVPFWLSTLDELGIVPKVVIPIRDPLEVADSLARRNQFPQSQALLIWLRHVLDAERASREASRAFLFYDDLLRDWRGVAKRLAAELDIQWPRWSSAVEAEIEVFLKPELRHFNADDAAAIENPDLERWVATARTALRTIAGAGPGAAGARQQLDGISAELDRLASIFGWRLREQDLQIAGQVTALKEQGRVAEQATHDLEKANDALKQARAALAASQVQTGHLQAAQAQQAERNAALESINLALEQRMEAVAAERTDMTARMAVCERKLALCRAELAALRGSQEAHQEAVARLPAALRDRDELAKRLAAHLSKAHWDHVAGESARPAWRRIGRRLLGRRVDDGEQAQLRALEASELFDGGYYLREYPDVLQAGMSPAAHYLRHGYLEGRNPSARFDTSWYLQRHSDVAASGMNPLLHYVMFGRAEGRTAKAVRPEAGPGPGVG